MSPDLPVTPEEIVNKKVAQAVEVKFQAVKIELEDSIKEHREGTGQASKGSNGCSEA